MFRKRISVSQERQITIPLEIYDAVKIEKELDCYIQDNAIVLRPVHESGSELVSKSKSKHFSYEDVFGTEFAKSLQRLN